MKLIFCASLGLALLYNNWANIGPDNEKIHLEKINNSRGVLVRV
jgi:hypothetical protein